MLVDKGHVPTSPRREWSVDARDVSSFGATRTLCGNNDDHYYSEIEFSDRVFVYLHRTCFVISRETTALKDVILEVHIEYSPLLSPRYVFICLNYYLNAVYCE